MADIVSIASGFVSNDIVTSLQAMPCLVCDFPGLLAYQFPAFFLLYYEAGEGEQPADGRLATGTFTFDPNLGRWSYDRTTPTDALSIAWPDAATGNSIELRLAWKSTTKASTYSQTTPIFLGPVSYVYPFGTEIDVPTRIGVEIKVAAKDVLHLDVTQTLAHTSCGLMAETRSFAVKGSFEGAAQRVELANFSYEHSPDGHLVVGLDATAKSGSLEVPIALDLSVTAGGTSRDSDDCGLRTIEPPASGSVWLSVGGGQSSVGFHALWDIEFEGTDYPQATRLNVDDAYLSVGDKRVDVAGFTGFDFFTEQSLESLVLSFADGVEMTVWEFMELLTIPALP